jgi:hypothetical protein
MDRLSAWTHAGSAGDPGPLAGSPVPGWVTTYVAAWKDRLPLHDWTIRVTCARLINDDPFVLACTTQYTNLNEAHIEIRSDCADTVLWRQTIIHELLHVVHARVDQFVGSVFLTLPPKDILEETYSNMVESMIDHVASTLYRTTCQLDYPEEHDDHEKDERV